ncbi:MAG: hypothetical protein OSA36_01785 [Acidimicrobiales bacterium]|nr:hypothetical protein [Acidimicrobiaceae bacterium]MBT6092730.1 hypothetical protein [Acidimicrobiaceae bacterium]MDE0833012.1 hypothetical protein [Acidimicrobiales bacterium]
MKKGRHRRYEEARALKQNQDLDLDSIFDSLRVDDQEDTTESPADDGWQADADEDGAESLEESTDTA